MLVNDFLKFNNDSDSVIEFADSAVRDSTNGQISQATAIYLTGARPPEVSRYSFFFLANQSSFFFFLLIRFTNFLYSLSCFSLCLLFFFVICDPLDERNLGAYGANVR